MNKRIGLLSLFGITVLLLAMVGAITALAAPSSATTATVKLDKAWYTIDSDVKITVTDPDANIKTAGAEAQLLRSAAALELQLLTLSGLGTGELVAAPKILLADNACPGGTQDTNLNVNVFNAAAGTITVQGGGIVSAGERQVCYDKVKVDTILISVKSGLDSTHYVNSITGLGNLVATETGVDTGKFTVSIKLTEHASEYSTSTLPTLKSTNADGVFSEYTDTTPTSGTSVKITSTVSKVETQKPTFSGLLPLNDFTTNASTTTFTGTVTDTGGSGVDTGSIRIQIDGGTPVAPTSITGNSGDTTVTFSHPNVATATEKGYTWRMFADDLAGNPGQSDSDTTSTTLEDHTFTVVKSNPKILTAGSSTATPATITTTGRYWNLSLSVPAQGKNRTTSLVVVFDRDLDATSVNPNGSDFTVTGNTVTAATIYAYSDSGSTVIKGRNHVYLTLGTAMARNGTPTVEIASGQSLFDLAGNVLQSGSGDGTLVAKDGIAPSFSFTLDKTKTKDTVVALITSTETVDPGTFTVKAHPATSITGATVKDFAVDVTGVNAWKATFSTATNAGMDGKYSVRVSGKDVPGNTGTKGKTSTTDPAAITFTQDTTVPSPVFTVGTVDFTAGVKDVQGASPLVSVNFGEKVTLTRAAFGVSGSAADVMGAGTQSTDGKTWLYQASGLVKDKVYQIIVSATDTAGNSVSDVSKTFKSIATKLPSTPLQPGQNLISFSGNPVNGDINVIFFDTSITGVATYDNQTGTFLTAGRGPNGLLSGSLTTIDGQHAYFVKSLAFGTLKVEIAKLGFDSAPSVIVVRKGWNMLSVVSVEGDNPGTTVSADAYLNTIRWTTAYSYDPVANAWTKIQPKSFANLEVGKGYWVYVQEDGVLVP